ncbi:MAG: S8 family serine peptidase [Cyanobacteria bacterium J06623_4]
MKRLVQKPVLRNLIFLSFLLAFLIGRSLYSPPPSLTQIPATPFAEGEFDSIVIDFREQPQVLSQLEGTLMQLQTDFGLAPILNSAFSEADNIYVAEGDRALLDRLQASTALMSQTEYIEPNYIYTQAGAAVNDPDYDKQWNFNQIDVEGAWRKGINGKGATVAVIDTGISQGADLQQTKLVAGYDFVNDREAAIDDNGHGTHVAGTIAQSTNNNYGVAGIAYGAKLMPLKVLSRIGAGTTSDIAEAIRFAADNGADVVNMSLGGGGESQLMREAIDYAYGKGVVVVAAAGNSGMESASYPALYEHAIGVSAVGPDQQKTSYSNYGTGVNIAAPGGTTRSQEADGILQETINPRTPGEFQFKHFQGTSMAAPHVAGVAALIKSQGRNVSPDRVLEILQSSAQAVKGDGQNYYGAGLLNAGRAVQMNAPVWLDWRGIDLISVAIKLASAAALTLFLTWLLRIERDRFNPFNRLFLAGVMFGSVGLFFIRILHVASLPHWPFRLLSSSIPEIGNAITNNSILNPLFASLVIPFGLLVLLISHPSLRWLSLGISVGVSAFLVVTAFTAPAVWLIGSGQAAQSYLLINALLCSALTAIFLRVAIDDQTRGRDDSSL